MNQHHKTAIIDPKSEIGRNVRIGPYSVIEADVRIGDETVIWERVHIGCGTTIGKNNTLHMGAVIGHQAQHRDGVKTGSALVIGDNNIFRESTTVHRGFAKGSRTGIGNNNFILAFAHVGHDSIIEDNITIANASILGGHVTLESNSFISAVVAIHQFCRVGCYALIGAMTSITKDTPPFFMVDNNEEFIGSINVVGLKRANFSEEVKREIKKAYKIL